MKPYVSEVLLAISLGVVLYGYSLHLAFAQSPHLKTY
jgi:hypothetical protein